MIVTAEPGPNTQTTAVELDPTTSIAAAGSTITLTTIEYTTTTTTEDNTPTVTDVSSFSSIESATSVISVPVTHTELLPTTTVLTTTEFSVSTDVQTILIVSTIVQVTTVAIEVTQTVTRSAFVTTTSYITVTSESPTTQLVGLVTCTERDINPTFTPTAPLPDNYTWGCPPGQICQPRQDNCNFEQGNPALTYFCSPEECIDAPPLPRTDLSDKDYSCGILYEPTPGYFEVDPIPFGLGYWIFDVNGQQARQCPVATTTTGWHDWTPRKGTFKGPPQRRQATSEVPADCYEKCNYCNKVAIGTGRVEPAICPTDTEFQKALGDCNDCIEYYKLGVKPDHVPSLLTEVHPYINVCPASSTSVVFSGTIIFTSSQTTGSATTAVANNQTVMALAQRTSAQAADAGIFALDAGSASQTTTVSMEVAETSGGDTTARDSSLNALPTAGSQGVSSSPTPGGSGDPEVPGSTAEGVLSSLRPTDIPSNTSSVAKSPANAAVYTGTGYRKFRTPSMAWLVLCFLGLITG